MILTTLKDLLYQDINRKDLTNWHKTKLRWARELKRFPKNSEVFEQYQDLVQAGMITAQPEIENSLKIRKIRTLSGVAPFAVMMKPYFCPGQCTYCVLEPGMPKSYMSDEPAAARAKQLAFDPRQQVFSRLEQMEKTGHIPEKLQLIVIGGTFSAYPDDYKREFLQAIYEAANEYGTHPAVGLPSLLKREGRDSSSFKKRRQAQSCRRSSIQEIHRVNESAKHRIIGMSIETRPDWVTDEEIRLLRDYGVTKVQLGVQALDNEINRLTRRGHDVHAVRVATQKLRDAGFKINYHFMPNLPGSTPHNDVAMCREMFEDSDFRPDTLKIYPCIVIPKTALWAQWQAGQYQSYDDETLAEVLVQCQAVIPEYCRVDRLVRDITRQWTASGTLKTNMRQIVDKKMREAGIVCKCIRCREVRDNAFPSQKLKVKSKKYLANNSKEYFIHFSDDKYLYGMVRLRLPLKPNPMESVFPVLKNAALIRELQVFGQQVPLTEGATSTSRLHQTQHQSLGKQLIAKAESVAKKAGYAKMAIISGVGVRNYYRKLGYELEDTYMIKSLI